MTLHFPNFEQISMALSAILTDASDMVKIAFIVAFVYLIAPLMKYAGRRESIVDAIKKKFGISCIPPHEECQYHHAIVQMNHMRTLWREMEVSWKWSYLRECLANADTMLSVMRVRMLDIYRGELIVIGIVDLDLDEEYDYYSHIVDRLVYEMRQRAERYFAENGYGKMTPQQLADYMVSRPASMLSNGAEILDIFHRSRIITRPHLRSINKSYMPEMQVEIGKTFSFAIDTAMRYAETRRLLYSEYSDMHTVAYGKPPIERCEI